MSNLDKDALKVFGREVAAAVAEGHTPEQIINRWDLAPVELEEIFASEPFSEALLSYGQEVMEAFKETRSTTRGGSIHRKISDNLEAYYKKLDSLAMSAGLKPEKQADILLTLMRFATPPDDKPQEIVQMPPSLLDNWARRHHTYERECTCGVKYPREASTQHEIREDIPK